MLWVPQKGLWQAAALAPASNPTADAASASTKGAIVQVVASTPFDTYWVHIVAHSVGASATATQGSMDLMIGPAGSELVLIGDMLIGYARARGGKVWDFPLYVPAGVRLGARIASANLGSTVNLEVYLYGGDGAPPFRVGQKVTTYGMGTVPDGTAITPGANGTTGSWTQIVAATSEDHFCFVPSWQISGDTTVQNNHQDVELGIGPAASEVAISLPYVWSADNGEEMDGPMNPMPTWVDVPSGTRLAVRATNQNANDAGYNSVIHALS